MPPTGFDEKGLAHEIQRIVSLSRRDPNTRQLLDCMSFALQHKYLSDFCVFPGRPGEVETFEDGVHEVVDQLELMVIAPRPEREIPIRTGPWVKGLPG
jgi:hypothetical protein